MAVGPTPGELNMERGSDDERKEARRVAAAYKHNRHLKGSCRGVDAGGRPKQKAEGAQVERSRRFVSATSRRRLPYKSRLGNYSRGTNLVVKGPWVPEVSFDQRVSSCACLWLPGMKRARMFDVGLRFGFMRF